MLDTPCRQCLDILDPDICLDYAHDGIHYSLLLSEHHVSHVVCVDIGIPENTSSDRPLEVGYNS